PAATAGPLVRAGLADALDREALDLGAGRVAGDAGVPGVDDVANARDGQGGLGDVRGQDDAPAGVRGAHPVLLGGGETGVERDDLGVAQLRLLQRLGGVADLLFAGEEDEDVAVALAAEFVHGLEDAVDLVALLLFVDE